MGNEPPPGSVAIILPSLRCVNTDPGFYCICDPGFIPTQDRRSCLDARQGSCHTAVSRSGQCRGKMPFQLSRMDCCCSQTMGQGWASGGEDLCSACPSRRTEEHRLLCQEAPVSITRIDECSLRSDLCPNGECVDTEEGYRCDCAQGFEMTADEQCRDTNECLQGVCRGGDCRNTEGGFHCQCNAGFHPSADKSQCIDHDECGQTGVCAHGKCSNMDGTFRCDCHTGFLLSDSGLSCLDTDECAENPLRCLRGRCRNTPGSYICTCEEGFELSADGAFCQDINECSKASMCSHGRCVNTEGGFQCLCDPGYEPRGSSCADINECERSPCQGGACTNTDGGFQCQCVQGFSLGTDGRTCTDSVPGLCYAVYQPGKCSNPSTKMVSKSTCCCCGVGVDNILGWGSPCSPCPVPGSNEYTQLCPHGPGFTHEGDDINECAQVPASVCSHGACENLAGGHRCLCNAGYERDPTGRQCVDIDECSLGGGCRGGQCRNTPGSYQCICPTGTMLGPDNNSCDDIDECAGAGSELCSGGECINSEGSYRCNCLAGSSLDSTGRVCVNSQRGSCWTAVSQGQCEMSLPLLSLKSECCCSIGKGWGSPCQTCTPEDCDCPKGSARTDGKTCRDVNECLLDPNICRGGSCVNTDGSFTCVCPTGLTLDNSGRECLDLRRESCYMESHSGQCSAEVGGVYSRQLCCCTLGEGWGQHCSQCPRPGTEGFNQLCSQGYGYVDSRDVNECRVFPGICRNGRCKNSLGSYSCRCHQGFALDEDGFHCVDIDECEILRGVCGNGSCLNTEGSFTCSCNQGFEITPMMQVCMDVNECEVDRSLCRGGECFNTPGSFLCQCPPGHELTGDGTSCKDIDECGMTSGVCSNGVCENMMGTYQCICDIGYQQADGGSSCEDVDECADNKGGCDSLCVNSPGSFSCSCGTGYMLLMDGRTCIDIDECLRQVLSNKCS